MAMRYRAALAAIALAGAGLAHAEEEGWKGDATLQWTMPRAGDEFATGIVAADHGALHLEARANYEAIHAQSAFVGGTFALGDTVKLEATPMAGFVGGSLRGPIAGLEATVSSGAVRLVCRGRARLGQERPRGELHVCVEPARLSPRRRALGALRARDATHAHLRRRSRGAARPVPRGDVRQGHRRRVLVQPRLVAAGGHRVGGRVVLRSPGPQYIP